MKSMLLVGRDWLHADWFYFDGEGVTRSLAKPRQNDQVDTPCCNVVHLKRYLFSRDMGIKINGHDFIHCYHVVVHHLDFSTGVYI